MKNSKRQTDPAASWPVQADIAKACRRIRAGWDEPERFRRASIAAYVLRSLARQMRGQRPALAETSAIPST